jgi:hypothetical protein
MLPYLRDDFGHPFNSQFLGRLSRAALDRGRDQVDALLLAVLTLASGLFVALRLKETRRRRNESLASPAPDLAPS